MCELTRGTVSSSLVINIKGRYWVGAFLGPVEKNECLQKIFLKFLRGNLSGSGQMLQLSLQIPLKEENLAGRTGSESCHNFFATCTQKLAGIKLQENSKIIMLAQPTVANCKNPSKNPLN